MRGVNHLGNRTLNVLHISDLHYAGDTWQEVDRCIRAVFQAAKHRVACVAITGDSTDHRLDAHSAAFRALAQTVQMMASTTPVIMLQGTFSHEPEGTLELLGLVAPNVFVASQLGQVALMSDGTWRRSTGYIFTEADFGEMSSSNTKVVFSALPTLNKANVAAMVGNDDASAAMGDAIAQVLQTFGIANAKFGEMGIATALLSHGTVHGCVTEHGVPMHGADHEYTSGMLFAARASATMLGHIHKQQTWELAARKIAYAGSIACLHYGEKGEKGGLLWSLTPEGAEFEVIASPTTRRVEFDFPDVPDMEVLKGTDVAGALVRLRYRVDWEHRLCVDDAALRAALVGASEIKIEPQILRIVRSRAEGIGSKTSDTERLLAWCGVTDTSPEGLEECLTQLAGKSADEIVAEALAA